MQARLSGSGTGKGLGRRALQRARKLFGVFGGLDGAGAAAQFPAQYWFAGVIEFFGGVLVAMGLFTGYAAFIASGEMAVAYFQNHFPKGFWPISNTGERAVFYCFTFLFISSRGAVRWGLDNFFSSRGKR